HVSLLLCFVSHDPATPELYPLSLHDALPISWRAWPFPTSTARRCRPIGLIRPAAVLSRQGEGAFVRWTPAGDFVGEEPVRGLLWGGRLRVAGGGGVYKGYEGTVGGGPHVSLRE